jgi:hypothetical protein
MSVDARTPSRTPRWIDRLLIASLLGFCATSWLFDRAAALDWVGPDVADPFGRALWWYGQNFDPLVAENPLFLRVMSGISAFAFGALYPVLAWGIAKRRNWVRGPSIVYAAMMLYSMFVHVVVELTCDTPPPNLPVFLGTYVPYIVVPAVLAWRMSPRRPFGA